jgi:hypothetical protein
LFNNRYAEMMSIPAASLEGQTLLDLFKRRKASGNFNDNPEEFFARVIAAAREGKSSTRVVEIYGRSVRVVEQPMPNGGWVSNLEDISEAPKAQARIAHMAPEELIPAL